MEGWHCLANPLDYETYMPTTTSDPTSATIYVRVPSTTKAAARAHADVNGLTLTAAISDLLERGLEAVEDEESVEALQEQLRAKDTVIKETEARFQGVQALATQPLGSCPTCGEVINAVDVLVRGQCAKGHPLRAPEAKQAPAGSGLDQTQSLMLIGAVGLLLGALALSNASG